MPTARKGTELPRLQWVITPPTILAPDWTGGDPDPDHSYDGGRTEYDNGKDGRISGGVDRNDTYCTGFYLEKDLPDWQLCIATSRKTDRICVDFAPTFPNRIFANAGRPTVWTTADIFNAADYLGHPAGRRCQPQVLLRQHPVSRALGFEIFNICEKFSVFLSHGANDTLPSVAYFYPSLTLVVNTANDDHPFLTFGTAKHSCRRSTRRSQQVRTGQHGLISRATNGAFL